MKSLRLFLQNELYNLFHSKSFLFVLLILLLIVTADDILAYKSYKDNLQLTLTTVDLQADGTFAEYPFLQIYTLYNSWIGGRANETLPMVFFYTMPVFVVIPYSWSYLAEEKNGYDRIMASQLGKASYFLGKYVSTFLSGALTVLLPMLFSFLLASCLVPAYRPDINFALYYQVSATKLLGNLYYAHPLCTAFLNMLMIGIFAGAWATIPLALSFFEKNKFVVLFAPYLVLLYIIASLQKASVYRSFTETSVLNYIWMTSSSSNQSIVVYTIMTVSLILLPLVIVLERGKNADVY